MQKIDANHSVAITTKKIDYKLFVVYSFSDGTTHDGFTDGRYDNKAYHFDSAWAVVAKEAPAGYTFDADASTNPLSGEKNFGYGDKTVTLKYTKNGDATVTVKYVIDGTETEIKTAYSQSGTIGTDYTIPETEKPASIEFEGKTYDFVSDGNAVYDSTYTQGGTVITRTYAEREKFTVKVLYISQADRTKVIGSQPEVSLYIPRVMSFSAVTIS